MATRKLVRLVHPKHFSEELSRFKSPAFKDTDGSGISVVDERCVEALPANLCEHIKAHYTSGISGEPPVFWRFEYSESFVQIVPDDSAGDPCHHNIVGISDKTARKMITKVKIEHMEICDGLGIRQLTLEDIRRQNA